MDRTTINSAILFSDVVGSSKLYKQLGDGEANLAISDCVAMMVDEVRRHQGVVVKTIGDEVMARFRTARHACAAGISIQQKSHSDPQGLNIRIGAAYGQAILADNDIFGEVVNDAAAVARVAQAHQFLVSQGFADQLLEPNQEYTVHPFDQISMKGSRQTTVIHRIDWEPQDITVNATQVADMGALDLIMAVPHVDLSYRRNGEVCHEITVTPDSTPFIIGRDSKTCSLSVPTDFASRDHFHIDHQRGKFIVKDHSTNGTYVREDGSDFVYLRREEMPLRGNGIITMGQLPDEADHYIRFDCARLVNPGKK